MVRSHTTWSTCPPPTAKPATMAITGLGRERICRWRSSTFRRGTLSSPTYPALPRTLWSPPEQNASVPAPVRMATPSSGSSRTSSNAWIISGTVSGKKEHVAAETAETVAHVLMRPLTHAAKGVREALRLVREPALPERGAGRLRQLPLRLEERERAPVVREPLHAAFLDPFRQRVVRLAALRPRLGLLDAGRRALHHQGPHPRRIREG